MLSDSDIREALRACYTAIPLSPHPLDVVGLGLIERITLTLDLEAPGANIPGVPPRQALTLLLISPTPDPDAQAQLQAQIANRLAGVSQLSRVEIHFAATPPWTPARLTPEARRRLNLDFPILNNKLPR